MFSFSHYNLQQLQAMALPIAKVIATSMIQAVPSHELEEIPVIPKGIIEEKATEEEPYRGIIVEEVHVDETDTSFGPLNSP